MIARLITALEQEYCKKFPGNPAVNFFFDGDQSDDEYQKLVSMFRNAIDTNTPLTEEDILTVWSKEAYEFHVAYLEGWEIPVKWK